MGAPAAFRARHPRSSTFGSEAARVQTGRAPSVDVIFQGWILDFRARCSHFPPLKGEAAGLQH